MRPVISHLGAGIHILSFSGLANILIRYFYFFIGLFIAGFGNYLTILAQNLGVSPWDVFHLGVAKHLPSLGLGTISMIVGAALLIPSFFLGIKTTFATFINMYYYGIVLNRFMSGNIVSPPANLLMSFLYLILGILIIGFGTAVYLLADTGTGPRDALMLGLCKKTGIRISKIRAGIEISAVILGVLLGGSFGIGTLIFSLTIGISLEIAMQLLRPIHRKLQSFSSKECNN